MPPDSYAMQPQSIWEGGGGGQTLNMHLNDIHITRIRWEGGNGCATAPVTFDSELTVLLPRHSL